MFELQAIGPEFFLESAIVILDLECASAFVSIYGANAGPNRGRGKSLANRIRFRSWARSDEVNIHFHRRRT